MSVHAHAPRGKNGNARPPTETRRCIAFTNPPPSRKTVWREGRGFRQEYSEPIEPEQCTISASPWLPEADYCYTHLPADAVLIVRQRMATYDALAAWLWESTLAEHPYTPDEGKPT